ncbi:MAG: DUF2628 domain-containing protein [Nitrosomonadaceae bacterium]
MHKYNVYKHPIIGYEAIKQGFSWPGFFFTWIWAFVKKLWADGVILLLVTVILQGLGQVVWARPDGDAPVIMYLLFYSVIIFGPSIYTGFFGNKWRIGSMNNRGYEFECTVMAGSAEGALSEAVKPFESRKK